MNKTIKKIDKLLTEIGKRSFCAVCGAQPAWLHHLLPKSTHPWLRAVVENLLPLCDNHHILSNDLAAHSSNRKAQQAFIGWLLLNRPIQYDCMEYHRNSTLLAQDWKQELAMLKARQEDIK